MKMKDSKSHREFVSSVVRDMPRSGIRDFFEIVETRDDVISLSIGEPDFSSPWHVREAAIYALDRGLTCYTSNLGMLELRQAVSAYLARSFQLDYDPREEILITVGVSEALDLALRALIEPGDEVLYHEPCYVSYAPIVRLAHGRPVPVVTRAEDDFRLTRDALEARVSPRSRVLLLNFPTNPTGAVLTREDVDALAAFAIEHDLVVITDEIYSELTYEGERTSIAAVPGMKERTIFLHGCSKAWAMTGFRIGFACAPPTLTEAMMKIHQYTMLCAPILSQKAAVAALERGDNDVAEMHESYRQRRNVIAAGLNRAGLPCRPPNGSFYIFPSIRHTGLSSFDFAMQLLEAENVACVPGTAFGRSGEGFIRCAFTAHMDDIREAVTRIQRFVASLPSGS